MSESVLDDSTDNSDISGMNEPSVKNNVKTNDLFVKFLKNLKCPQISSHSIKPLTVDARLQWAVENKKKVMQALYCRFCGKACRKIELHLKCDNGREPEVVKAFKSWQRL